jgi:hypothetical protein
MLLNNKKGVGSIILSLMFFSIIIVFIMFMFIMSWELFDTNILDRFVSGILSSNINMSSTSINTVNNIKSTTQVSGSYFDFDLIFFLLGLLIIIFSIYKSYNREPVSVMKVIPTLIIVHIMFGILVVFFEDIITWFTTQILFNVISDINLPIFENYIENFGLYLFVLINIIIIVNQLPLLVGKFAKGGFSQ